VTVREPEFLTLDEVLALHADQIDRYGGAHGIRDLGLLESAHAAPRSTLAGGFLHGTVPEMAAAYLFHIVRNHPFVDGNKRVGLTAAIAFLGLNGLWLEAEEDALVDLVVGVAEGRVAKAEVAVFLQRHVVPL
jgi:death-on-curing protein